MDIVERKPEANDLLSVLVNGLSLVLKGTSLEAVAGPKVVGSGLVKEP